MFRVWIELQHPANTAWSISSITLAGCRVPMFDGNVTGEMFVMITSVCIVLCVASAIIMQRGITLPYRASIDRNTNIGTLAEDRRLIWGWHAEAFAQPRDTTAA